MHNNSIDLQQAIKVLIGHPLFSSWPKEALDGLAKVLKQQSFRPEETIVEQDELIDSFYFIIEGKAEVMHFDPAAHPVATLLPGETIGLTATGFFSKSSTRTATVTALTPLVALRLDIEDLRQILHDYPNLNNNLEQASVDILKLRLIKQAAPFADLSIAKLHTLVNKIEEKIIPAGAILFQQGEIGDYCYLICKGKISISRFLPDGKITHLATLTDFDVFGETSLLMSAPRNASATAINDSKLLALPRDVFLELIAEEKTSDKLTVLMLKRIIPKHNPNILVYPSVTADGQKITILKNPENKAYFQLNEDGSLVWKLLNTNHTVHEMLLFLAKEAAHFSIDDLKTLILDLSEEEFVQVQGIRSAEEAANLTWWERIIDFIKSILEINYTFNDVDPWLTKTYSKGVKYLFSKPAKFLFATIGILGFIIFILFAPKAINSINTQHFSWLIIDFVIGFITVIPHELGHAYTAKAYGREVNYFGVGWYWICPIAFTDTTDTWLCTRNQRLAVDVAGIYVNFILAGLLAISILFISNFAWYMWLLALMSYLLIYLNLDPSLEFDGYYILMDYLDHPNLREDAIVWLLNIFTSGRHCLSELKKHYTDNEMIYWLSIIVVIAVRFGIVLLLQTLIIHHNFISIKYFWALPLVIVILSFASVWVDFRKSLRNIGQHY